MAIVNGKMDLILTYLRTGTVHMPPQAPVPAITINSSPPVQTYGTPTLPMGPHPTPQYIHVSNAIAPALHDGGAVTDSQVARSGTTYHARPVPPVGAPIIPDLVTRDGKGLWWCVVLDWKFADPERRLWMPLKDWPPEYYTKTMSRVHGVKYRERKLIAEEYINQYVMVFVTIRGRDTH